LLISLFSYFLSCIASSASAGNVRFGIKSAMEPLNARIGANTPGTSEIQRIDIGGSVTSESQVHI